MVVRTCRIYTKELQSLAQRKEKSSKPTDLSQNSGMQSEDQDPRDVCGFTLPRQVTRGKSIPIPEPPPPLPDNARDVTAQRPMPRCFFIPLFKAGQCL